VIGIDVVLISRIERFIDRFKTDGLRRFLSEDEIDLARNTKSIAGFWAAKEAASKALGVGIGSELGFKNIHIAKTKKGGPIISFDDEIVERFSIDSAALSITHDGDLAIAVVFVTTGHPLAIREGV